MELCGENWCYGNAWRELVLWKCVEKIVVMEMCGEYQMWFKFEHNIGHFILNNK
jgi:hypothetical protein